MKALPSLLLLLALCSLAFSQNPTTFVNGPGNYPHCLPVTSEDGRTVGGGDYACFQPTEYQTGTGFSLYLPDVTLESCSIAYGPFVATSGTGSNSGDTVSQTSAVSCAVGNGWNGRVTENFVKVWSTCRSGGGRYYHTYACLVNSSSKGKWPANSNSPRSTGRC